MLRETGYGEAQAAPATSPAAEATSPAMADGSDAGSSREQPFTDNPPNTLFIKVERLRRLHRSDELVYRVRRGEDGTFGLGLSEDNEIVHFFHEENADVLRLGDQVRSVGPIPLVRERLATLLKRHHPEDETVELHISRSSEQPQKRGGDVFATLQLRTNFGEDLDEWMSELWSLRTDAVWGTFWTIPLPSNVHAVYIGIHYNKLFTEPLLGWLVVPIASLQKETLDCRWCAPRRAPQRLQSAGALRATAWCPLYTSPHTSSPSVLQVFTA